MEVESAVLAERIRMTFALADIGREMQRSRLKRHHPDLPDEEIDRRLRAALLRPWSEGQRRRSHEGRAVRE